MDPADGSCRRCRVYCDWVVEPTGCLGCPSLYAYDARDGRRYAGCLERVHAAEIDLRVLEEAGAEGRRFGGIRCARRPLERCDAVVEAAYPHRLPELGCVNPEFREPPGGAPIIVTVLDESEPPGA
jgi:hypothetical protein